ncbi:hypothetical protein [Nostoc sp.]
MQKQATPIMYELARSSTAIAYVKLQAIAVDDRPSLALSHKL